MPWQGKPIRPSVSLGVSDDKIRFVWVTDIHIATIGDAAYNNLMAAIARSNALRPQAFVMTGDYFTYGTAARWVPTSYKINDVQAPLIMVQGGHDEEENTYGHGHPNTAVSEAVNIYNQSAPFFYTMRLVSGDGTLTALCVIVDQNYYNGFFRASPYHQNGDRMGLHNDDPGGGYSRQMGTAQLEMIRSALAGDRSADIVLLFIHAGDPVEIYDQPDLAALLVTDGRPCCGFYGHDHAGTRVRTLSATGGGSMTLYKAPAMYESGAWTVVTLGKSGSAVSITSAVIENYTNPGGWTISAPFSVS